MTAEHGEGEEERSANARAAASRAIGRAQAAEPAITPEVRDVVEGNGGTLVRLDSRIKAEDSLTEKIRRRMRSDNTESEAQTAESEAQRIEDVLRYTALLPEEDYWPAGTRLCEALASAGYGHFVQSSGWQSHGYRGRNERFEAPGGYRFELQIHTQASLSRAEATHDWYEEQRRLDTPLERQWELQQMQDYEFDQVPIPPGTPVH